MTATPLVLLIIASGLLFVQVMRMSDAARSVVHSEEAITWFSDLERRFHHQHVTVLEQLLRIADPEPESIAAVEVRNALREVRRLVAGNETQVSQLRDVRTSYATWQEQADQAKRSAAQNLPFERELRALSAARERLVESVRAMEREERRIRTEHAQRLEAVTSLTVYGALPLLLLISLAIGINSRRQLLRLARDFTEAIAGQTEAKRLVELQSWGRERLVRLIGATRGDANTEILGRRLLEEMVDATGAEIGAFYVQEEGRWSRIADYALSESAPKEVPYGRGLLGEVASGTKYRRVTKLPTDYLWVTSGTGSGPAAEVAIVPCHHEEEVLAVLELAFLRPIAEQADLLLTQAGESMGVAMAVALKRGRLRSLLVESRRQAEALQQQQEELRVTNEELSTQSEALRAAHAQLEERKEELEVSNSNLVKQRDELREAQRKLEQHALELRRANRYKSEFLASMSHELRTPLNSSLILSQILAENRTGNLTAEQVRFAETIHASGRDLLSLINDVLDLSKIEAGAIELTYAETTVADLVRPIVRITDPIARDRGLELSVDLQHFADANVCTDVQRVQQILKNLLSNACKFTIEGGVTLSTHVREGVLEILVRDTGVGIAVDQLEAIFEPFRQGDATTNRRFSGTGLGLSISRDFARRLGGDVTVESTPGVGSCFRLAIPVKPPEGSQVLREADSAPAETVDEPESLDLPPSGPPATRPLVLVLQDDPRLSDTVSDVARSLNFDCMVANDAEKALRLARRYRPSAIVLDATGGGEARLADLEKLKQADETAQVPVHIIGKSDSGREALSRAAVGYLQKPVDLDALKKALLGLVERAQSPRRILIVEDDPTHRDALHRLLNLPDVEIVSVGTVAAALDVVRRTSFVCIVTDLVLPDASGHELLRKLASEEEYAFPNVIVYTGKPLAPEEEQELMRYSDSIIVKGARSPERLLDEVMLFLHQVESTLVPARQQQNLRPRSSEGAFQGKRVLLAEDDVRNVFALTSVLERLGVELVVARNGREAVDCLARGTQVDLVLMDIMMPEMDGLEATRKIRELGGAIARIPVIALTAKAMRNDREACIKAGANDYNTKPIDVDKLLSLMQVWMSR